MFTNATQVGLRAMYQMYLSREYATAFRNFDDFMHFDQFVTALSSQGTLMQIEHEGKFAGFLVVGINPKTRMAALGIGLLKEFQSKGLAVKAVVETMHYLFSKGLLRLVCMVSRDDKRSMELLEKGKFLPEARLRGNCFYNNKLHDEIRWVMPRELYFKHYAGKE